MVLFKLSNHFWSIERMKCWIIFCTVDILGCAHVWRGGRCPCVRLLAVPKEGRLWQAHECPERSGTRFLCDWTPNRTPNTQIWFWSVAQAMTCDESCKYSYTFLSSVSIHFYFVMAILIIIKELYHFRLFTLNLLFHLLKFYSVQKYYLHWFSFTNLWWNTLNTSAKQLTRTAKPTLCQLLYHLQTATKAVTPVSNLFLLTNYRSFNKAHFWPVSRPRLLALYYM